MSNLEIGKKRMTVGPCVRCGADDSLHPTADDCLYWLRARVAVLERAEADRSGTKGRPTP